MGQRYAIVWVKNGDVDALRAFVRNEIGVQYMDPKCGNALGLVVEIDDYRAEFEGASRFMRENGLQEDHPVLREFDQVEFSVNVTLWYGGDCVAAKIIEPLADVVGERISRAFDTETMVWLPYMEVPYCVYRSGKMIRQLLAEHERYFCQSSWLPKAM